MTHAARAEAGDYYMVVVADIPEFTDEVLEYAKQVNALVEKFGGRYIVRGGAERILEGNWETDRRIVISRWPSREKAEQFWYSEEYQKVVKPIRSGTGDYDVALFPAL